MVIIINQWEQSRAAAPSTSTVLTSQGTGIIRTPDGSWDVVGLREQDWLRHSIIFYKNLPTPTIFFSTSSNLAKNEMISQQKMATVNKMVLFLMQKCTQMTTLSSKIFPGSTTLWVLLRVCMGRKFIYFVLYIYRTPDYYSYNPYTSFMKQLYHQNFKALE